MDRAGNTKVKKYILVWLFMVLLLLLGIAVYSLYCDAVDRKQIMEIIKRHPELEAELIQVYENKQEMVLFGDDDEDLLEEKYGYDVYGSIVNIKNLVLCSFMAIGCGIGILILVRSDRRRSLQDDTLLELVDENLQNFKKGDYAVRKDFVEGDCDVSVSDRWETIFESLKELGYFFEDLKTKLGEEENSTKALITDISHQLKTPLASLRMCHELTTTGNLTEDERKEFQEQERREIEKLELLLNELVKLSRLENHMVQINPVQQGIRGTISEAVSQIYGKAKGKQIEIQVDSEVDVKVLHDRKWTAEALSNILDNAIKYSENGTTVKVRVQELQSNLLIEIEDQGMGIPSGELHNIFKRFYRGKEAVRKVKDGVGVGLYLARNIIEHQGGTITVKSRQKSGTIFRVTLPI